MLVPRYRATPEDNLIAWLLSRQVIRILRATSDRALSPLDLTWRTGVPIAQSYRIVNELARRGLVVPDRKVRNRRGKVTTYWRSNIARIAVSVSHASLRVSIERRDGVVLTQELRATPAGPAVMLAALSASLLETTATGGTT